MMVVLKKMLRFFALLLLGVFIAGNLFIILSGRFYLYNGIYNTYLSGHSSPTIYDLDVFHNSKLDKSEHPIDYVISKYYNKQVVADTDKVFLEEMDTKAFLVFKGDTLLFEEYYDEHDKDELSNSFSMAKSVVAMLIGIAIEEGYIESLDTKVGKYLPEFSSGEKSHITIRHLLIMASGLDWTESGKNPLSDNAESYYGWDLRNLVLNQKAIEEP
ncbi:MAG: class C beta-lactamase-related serine hydrolase, partial [Bacteroidetes bacterium]